MNTQQRIRALLVEPDPAECELIRSQLLDQADQIELSCAASGPEAVDELGHEKYDVLVVDMSPGGAGGFHKLLLFR